MKIVFYYTDTTQVVDPHVSKYLFIDKDGDVIEFEDWEYGGYDLVVRTDIAWRIGDSTV